MNSRKFMNTLLLLAVLSLVTIESYPGTIASVTNDDRDSSDSVSTSASPPYLQFSRRDTSVAFSFDLNVNNYLVSIPVFLFAVLLLLAISLIEKSIALYFNGRAPPAQKLIFN